MLRASGLLLALCLAAPAGALDPHRLVTQYIVDSYSMEDGLPSTEVNAIAQTPDGYLWIATTEGLVRYDGVRFRVFDRHNTPLITVNDVADLLVDKTGALVAATRGGLLVLRDGELRRYDTGQPLPDQRLSSVAQAPDGSLWLGSNSGVHHLRAGKLTSYGRKDGLPDDRVLGLRFDDDGVLWILTYGGAARLDGGRIAPLRTVGDALPSPVFAMLSVGKERWLGHRAGVSRLAGDRVTTVPGLPASSTMGLIRDRDGVVWAGVGDRLARFVDGKLDLLDGKSGYTLQFAQAFFEDREGNLWIGGLRGNLYRLRDGKVTAFGEREGMAAQSVGPAVEEPATGALYFGTHRGLNVWRDGKMRVYTTADGLHSAFVSALLPDGAGGMIVGTSAGIEHFDGSRFTLWRASRDNSGAVARDRGGHLWTEVDGGIVEQLAADVWQPRLPQSMAWMLEADGDGSMWAATTTGLFHFVDGKAERVAPEMVMLYRDSDGALWTGSESEGLQRRSKGKVAIVRTGNGLHDDDVTGMIEDGLGYAWLATPSGIERVKKSELDAVADGRAERLGSQLFGRADGMPSVQCSGVEQPTVSRTRDGRLLFSTFNGVVVIDPAHLRSNPLPPPVVIEALAADGHALDRRSARVAAGTRALHIEYTALSFVAPERVRFKYRLEGFDRGWIDAGKRRFADYMNLAPGRYRFQVLAANDDGVWNESGAATEIVWLPFFWQTRWFMTLLTLGGLLVAFSVYRLRVRGLIASERRLTRLVGERTRELREAQADLVRAEKMASVATLVRGIAHELNNPIGFISGNLQPLRRYTHFLSGLAQTLSDGSQRSAEQLAALTRLSERKDLGFVCRDLDKMMDDIDEGALRARLIIGDLQNLTAPSRRELGEIDVERAVRQTLMLLSPRLPARATVEVVIRDAGRMTAQLGQIEQLMTNLIDNSMRAIGPDGHICVSAVSDGDDVVLSVRDSGVGMPEEVRRRATDPFFTTRPPGEGSGLGLAIVASIVAGHGGTLDIESGGGSGTTVTVRLPRHAAADERRRSS